MGGNGEPRPHQLHFVHDPKAVVVEKSEVHRPAVAGHAVATVKGAGEEHVLSSDKDGLFLGIEVPVAVTAFGTLAAHQDDDAGFKSNGPGGMQLPDPLAHFGLGLLNEGAHGEAVDKAAWPSVAMSRWLSRAAVPEPTECNGRGLAEARGHVDEE